MRRRQDCECSPASPFCFEAKGGYREATSYLPYLSFTVHPECDDRYLFVEHSVVAEIPDPSFLVYLESEILCFPLLDRILTPSMILLPVCKVRPEKSQVLIGNSAPFLDWNAQPEPREPQHAACSRCDDVPELELWFIQFQQSIKNGIAAQKSSQNCQVDHTMCQASRLIPSSGVAGCHLQPFTAMRTDTSKQYPFSLAAPEGAHFQPSTTSLRLSHLDAFGPNPRVFFLYQVQKLG